MSATVTRAEFDQLKGRVAQLEQEADGEKSVSRYILEQTRRNGDDLAALRTRMDRLEGRIDRLEASFQDLRTALPKIVGNAVRDVLKEER